MTTPQSLGPNARNALADKYEAWPNVHLQPEENHMVIAALRSLQPVTAGREEVARTLNAATEQLKILNHWGASPDPVRVTGVVFQNAAFTMQKLIDAILSLSHEAPAQEPVADLDARQAVVIEWGAKAFGADHMADKIVRAARFFEEAAEMVQAVGLPRDHAQRAFEHVYSRPAGDPAQEAGGSANTLMALCGALGLSLDECQRAEIDRCLAKDPAHFAARNEAKLREVDAAPVSHATREALEAAKDFADNEFNDCCDLPRKYRLSKLCDKIDAALAAPIRADRVQAQDKDT